MQPKPKPNVFLAGAPKCGTTSLASWLAGHPQCYVTPKKEPHFFSGFLRNGMSIEEYEALFSGATPAQGARVDASTSYFTDAGALEKIMRYNPASKFIVMLRNPLELSYSLHGEVVYSGAETESDFVSAWRLQERRRKRESVPVSCPNPGMLLYYEQALLGEALTRLLQVADKEAVHWVFLEDLIYDPRRCYTEVLAFLGLEDDGRMEFPRLNRAKRHRFPGLNRTLRTLGRWRARVGLHGLGIRKTLNRYSRIETERPPLPDEFKWELYEDFRGDIRLLERLTGRDLSHWAPKWPENRRDVP